MEKKRYVAYDDSWGPLWVDLSREAGDMATEFVELTEAEVELVRAAEAAQLAAQRMLAERFVNLHEMGMADDPQAYDEDPNDPYVRWGDLEV